MRIGRLADSSLVARRLGEVRRVLVASPAYLAARGGMPRTPDDLAGHEAIFSTGGRPGPVEWRFHGSRDGVRGRVVRLAPRLLVSEAEAGLVAARMGRGIAAALSYQVVNDLAAGVLIRLLPDHEPPALPVQLVTSASGRYRAPSVSAFLDHAARHLAALEAIRPTSPAARRASQATQPVYKL